MQKPYRHRLQCQVENWIIFLSNRKETKSFRLDFNYLFFFHSISVTCGPWGITLGDERVFSCSKHSFKALVKNQNQKITEKKIIGRLRDIALRKQYLNPIKRWPFAPNLHFQNVICVEFPNVSHLLHFVQLHSLNYPTFSHFCVIFPWLFCLW